MNNQMSSILTASNLTYCFHSL